MLDINENGIQAKMLHRIFILLVSVHSPLVGMQEQRNTPICIQNTNTKCATIQQFIDKKIEDIAGEFWQKEEISKAITSANLNSLYRKFFGKQGALINIVPAPHIALARVVYMKENVLHAYNIPYVFTSTIQNNDVDRFEEQHKGALKDVARGIAPFKGSPCRFAHSERGVAIFLIQEAALSIKLKNASLVLIQIKTSLPPCEDCKAFWEKEISFSKDANVLIGGNFACDDGKPEYSEDILKYLKKEWHVKKIGININCNIQFQGQEVKSSALFERYI